MQEGDNEVVVTAYIGTLPAIADRQESGEPLSSMMKPVVHPVAIRLGAPLGACQVRDGAHINASVDSTLSHE